MKLTIDDKKILKDFGCNILDFFQIEKAMGNSITTYEIETKPISREEAKELLGKKIYLSGISRSAFHGSAARETKDGRAIYFDSSRLFR